MNRKWTFTMSLIASAMFAVACSSSGSNSASQAAPKPSITPASASASQPTTPASATASQPTTPASAKASVATSAPALKEFVSKRYGFRVTLTDEWLEQDASVDWDGAFLQGTESSAFANFPNQAINRTLVVGAAPAPKGTKLAQWRAAMVAAAPSGCSESPSVEKTTLGGEPALAWATVCEGDANVYKVAALHGNRGYIFFLASDIAIDKTADRRTFDSIRRSFRFNS